jgi:hypothetical protein
MSLEPNAEMQTAALQISDPDAQRPDAFFDRQWALNVLDRALNALAAELNSAGKIGYFETSGRGCSAILRALPTGSGKSIRFIRGRR